MENHKKRTKKTTITFLAILIFLGWSIALHSLELKKEHEWEFFGETQFFVLENQVHVWSFADRALYLYPVKGERKTIFTMGQGEGPGDCLLVNRVLFDGQHYLAWDRRLMRISTFSRSGKYINSEKIIVPILSAFIGQKDGGYLFKWNSFDGPRGRRRTTEQITLVEEKGKKKSILVSMAGIFNKGETLNYDRPHLLYARAGNKLYYADNREYKIYQIDITGKEPVSSPSVYATREYERVQWQKKHEELQWEILKKPRKLPEVDYPAYLPPLFAIAVSDTGMNKDTATGMGTKKGADIPGPLLAVVNNARIGEKKAVIDIFRGGRYLGSGVIPILHRQHFIFPFIQAFPPEIYLSRDALYTVHYFSDEEVYKIIKWRIGAH